MRLVSAARRLAVTVPFFATATVLLAFFSHPEGVPVPGHAAAGGGILIVTTSDLDPAFRALESWNEQHGCAADVVTLPRRRTLDAAGLAATLSVLSRERGVSAILLGGDRRQLPVSPADSRVPGLVAGATNLHIEPVPTPEAMALPSHLWMARAPVATLPEAWAFVDACRRNGKTLDQLIRGGGALAVLPGELPRPAAALPAVALPAPSD